MFTEDAPTLAPKIRAMATPPRLRLVEFGLETAVCRTRQPFRFGIHTLTEARLGVARGRVEFADGSTAWGQASDLLVPKWFEKDPDKSLADDAAALVESARTAARLAQTQGHGTVFDLWHGLHLERMGSTRRTDSDLLVRGYGVALVERLLIDAVARKAGCSFHDALRDNTFGFEPGRVHAELDTWRWAETLPRRPARAITLRHTVGMADRLRAEQGKDAVLDGLPETLSDDINRHGLTHFKIKVAGVDGLERLLEVSRILRRQVPGAARFTLDGNEQFADLGELADLLEGVRTAQGGAEFLSGLLFIEQPLPRSMTFEVAAHSELATITAQAPLLIDEADLDIWAFPAAIELGYHGVSVKACKGVFRALLNTGLCHTRGGGLFQSGEDLTNLPVIALHQDLCLMATLGIEHVERNDHHYFRGLDHLPPDTIAYALKTHGDLYERDGHSARLAIEHGRLAIASLDRPGFGADLLP